MYENRNANVFLLVSFVALLSATANAVDTPKTIEAAHQRLTKILGTVQDQPRLTRFVIDEELETQPEKDGPKVIVVNKGQEVFTNPSIQGDSIVFSHNEILVRDVFNEAEDGKRTPNRHLDRTYAIETKITRYPADLWIVEHRLVNHSIPRFNGTTVGRGTVKWLENGVEFATTGFDTMYAPDGSVQPTAYVNIERYSSDGSKLVIYEQFQAYDFATDSDGRTLLVPDLQKPSGKPVEIKRVSEARE